jgi:nitrate reductase alpha subunit
MIRGRLLDLYRAEKKSGKDPVEAWAAIQADSAKRDKYVKVRGLGGFVRTTWDEVLEITAAANVHTINKWGPDRIYGFSPIPAMSMISYAAGSRYLSLIGAACGSFYDWYCDLPIASPQTWGEQTDVPEAADWYNSTYLIITGANLPMTRTPDAHFAIETRYKGTKIVSMAPDYAEYVKFADLWMPVKQGTDSAAFMAMGHVALKEFYINKETPYFQEYARKYTDMPMQVMLRQARQWLFQRPQPARLRLRRQPERSQQPGMENHRLRRGLRPVRRAQRHHRFPLGRGWQMESAGEIGRRRHPAGTHLPGQGRHRSGLRRLPALHPGRTGTALPQRAGAPRETGRR